MSVAPKPIAATELSLRLLVCRGARAYFIYLVRPGDTAGAIEEIDAELRALDDQVAIGMLFPPSAARLLHEWPARTEDVLLVGAESYTEDDWALLDRRLSDLARQDLAVFLTTPSAFETLMQVAPHLASGLGGLVFSREDPRRLETPPNLREPRWRRRRTSASLRGVLRNLREPPWRAPEPPRASMATSPNLREPPWRAPEPPRASVATPPNLREPPWRRRRTSASLRGVLRNLREPPWCKPSVSPVIREAPPAGLDRRRFW